MKKIRVITLLALIFAGLAFVGSFSCGTGSGPTNNGEKSIEMLSAAAPKAPLNPNLPYDVSLPPKQERNLRTNVLKAFDAFSWQSFIAICWPTQHGQIIGQFGDNQTVFETWKKTYDVFLPDGQKPSPWDSMQQSGEAMLEQVEKVPPQLSAAVQPFMSGPLIDLDSQYTRFEIAINKQMFEYIIENTLYNQNGQRVFGKNLSFPEGNDSLKTFGAIEIKASWKILGKNDDTARFHKIMARIIDKSTTGKYSDTTYEAWVGLVGLHIATKTATCPQWIWSTFEQVDNVPDSGKVAPGKHYNYYNDAARIKTLNKPPVLPWDPRKPNQIPCQVARLTSIDAVTQTLNDSLHKLLTAVNPKSVWQYYELVGTQWPTQGAAGGDGVPFPTFLANATLETYDQPHTDSNANVPGVTSSCIHCHAAATTVAGPYSDFSYVLHTAKALKDNVKH